MPAFANVPVTGKTVDLLERLRDSTSLSNAHDAAVKSLQAQTRLTTDDLRQLSSIISSSHDASISLLDVVRAGDAITLTDPPVQVSPELARRREFLRARHEQREYARMCSNVSTMGATITYGADEVNADKSTTKQIAFGFNFLIAGAAIFFGVNYALEHGTQVSKHMRLFLSLLAFVVVFTAEMTLYIIRAVRAEKYNRDKKKSAEERLFPGKPLQQQGRKPPRSLMLNESVGEPLNRSTGKSPKKLPDQSVE